MKLLLLPFGLKDGGLTHISAVPSGLACECSCPACGDRLVAKKGVATQHHFAHQGGTDCAQSLETALHLAAKDLLERRMQITLPKVEVKFDGGAPDIQLRAATTYAIDRVILEKRIDSIIPDVLAFIGGAPLIVEVRVTHAVGAEKQARIAALGMSAIEIDLSEAPRTFELSSLEATVVDDVSKKVWLFNSVAHDHHRALLSAAELKQTVMRGVAVHVDNCPINSRVWRGRSYANVSYDCLWCNHALAIGQNMESVTCGAGKNEPPQEQLSLL